MRILFLAQLLPYPLTAGPKVRAYYVLRLLRLGLVRKDALRLAVAEGLPSVRA
jgi:hypothetical protein